MEIPPPSAVISLDISLPKLSVVNPRTISLSLTINSCA
jgi:hypothetical protein